MPNQSYEERTFGPIGRRLRRVFDDAYRGARITEKLKEAICSSLLEAYNKTSMCCPIVDIDIPGERPRGGGKVPDGYTLPSKHPGDEREDVYEEVIPVHRCRVNQDKIDILNEALGFGCKWAEEERKKLE